MRRNIYLSVMLIIAFSITAFSQQTTNGKISGKIFLENKKAATKATITLLQQKDSATIKLSVPDDNGSFEFENLKNGNYLVSVSYTGYKKYYTVPIKINDAAKTISVPDIILETANNTLSEVTVEAKKPFI